MPLSGQLMQMTYYCTPMEMLDENGLEKLLTDGSKYSIVFCIQYIQICQTLFSQNSGLHECAYLAKFSAGHHKHRYVHTTTKSFEFILLHF